MRNVFLLITALGFFSTSFSQNFSREEDPFNGTVYIKSEDFQFETNPINYFLAGVANRERGYKGIVLKLHHRQFSCRSDGDLVKVKFDDGTVYDSENYKFNCDSEAPINIFTFDRTSNYLQEEGQEALEMFTTKSIEIIRVETTSSVFDVQLTDEEASEIQEMFKYLSSELRDISMD